MQPDHVVPYVFGSPVQTERLTLRLMTESDVDDIHSYQSREDVCRYLLYEPRTREEVAEHVAKHAVATTLEKDGDYWQLAMELPATTGSPARVVGDIYFEIASLANSKAEIGWSLHPDFAGKGYALRAQAPYSISRSGSSGSIASSRNSILGIVLPSHSASGSGCAKKRSLSKTCGSGATGRTPAFTPCSGMSGKSPTSSVSNADIR
jgi:Acetyltransferase (GNAT) domain